MIVKMQDDYVIEVEDEEAWSVRLSSALFKRFEREQQRRFECQSIEDYDD